MAQAIVASDHTDFGELEFPFDFGSASFAANKYAYYRWLREEAPVYKGRISLFSAYFVSRYDDCVDLLKDPRFARNRTTATGGRRSPIPMPRLLSLLRQSMIVEDDPEHRRLRNLVKQAFTPAALAHLAERIERLTHELLDEAEARGRVDLMPTYALPIPVTVISEMVGISDADMPRFQESMTVLSRGLSGLRLLRTLLWDLRGTAGFIRELIARKRCEPRDDILTGLIRAEEDEDRLKSFRAPKCSTSRARPIAIWASDTGCTSAWAPSSLVSRRAIALRNLLERNPNLRLAVPAEALRFQNLPLWHRHGGLPVALG